MTSSLTRDARAGNPIHLTPHLGMKRLMPIRMSPMAPKTYLFRSAEHHQGDAVRRR